MRRTEAIMLFSIFAFLGAVVYAVRTLDKSPNEMVLVPAGHFWMGCNEEIDTSCQPEEYPYRKVFLESYYIDRREVTVSAYRACVQAERCQKPPALEGCNFPRLDRGNHPINCVNSYEAKEYCAFVGKTLPSEEQWEKAARGTDGRLFPWGNVFQAAFVNHQEGGEIDGYPDTAPVGSFPRGASPYGALDMAGNCWEWTSSLFTPDPQSHKPITDGSIEPYHTQGPSVISKGGAWNTDHAWPLRASGRTWDRPARNTPTHGFRCVKNVL